MLIQTNQHIPPALGVRLLNIPAGFSSDNLPIGLQLVSDSFKEETLISLAHILGEEEIFEAN